MISKEVVSEYPINFHLGNLAKIRSDYVPHSPSDCDRDSSLAFTPVSMLHVYLAFSLLAGGYVVSVAIAVFEIGMGNVVV